MSEEIDRLSGSKNIREPLLVSAEAADRNKHEIYEFGPFRLEPAERKLLRGCEVVALTPKVFDMLVMLVRKNGHLMEKDELIQLLWPDSFVEEGNLSNNVFVLRKALGNDYEYIETVPRRLPFRGRGAATSGRREVTVRTPGVWEYRACGSAAGGAGSRWRSYDRPSSEAPTRDDRGNDIGDPCHWCCRLVA